MCEKCREADRRWLLTVGKAMFDRGEIRIPILGAYHGKTMVQQQWNAYQDLVTKPKKAADQHSSDRSG